MKPAFVCLVILAALSVGCQKGGQKQANAGVKRAEKAAVKLPAQRACTPLRVDSLPPAGHALPKVSVYWDVSGSVSSKFDSVVSFLVSSMDSSILQLAQAAAPYRHYAVGNRVQDATNASVALVRSELRSALHDAFMRTGEELAQKHAGLSIIVTDLEIDAPSVPKGTERICSDVPVPSDGSKAAPIIGRCLASGWRSKAKLAKGGLRPIDDLVIRVFRSQASEALKNGQTRHLYVVVIATDLGLEDRFAKQFRAKTASFGAPRFDEWVVVNTQNRPTVSLSWRPPTDGSVRISDGQASRCAFSCFDEDARFVVNAGSTSENPGFLSVAATPTATPSAGLVRVNGSAVAWTIPCVAPREKPETLTLELTFPWESRFELNSAAVKRLAIDHSDVEDVLQSVIQEVHPVLAPRTTRVVVSRR